MTRPALAIVVAALTIAVFFLGGCAAPPTNPSFDLTVSAAEADLKRMAREPVRLERPLLILGGYGDPGFADSAIFDTFEPSLSDSTVLRVSMAEGETFEDCRVYLMAAIEEAFPSPEDRRTIEFDVVANSMGGLVALDASDPRRPERYLRIARLFAISTPFRGSNAAVEFNLSHPLVEAMRPGAPFLERIAELDGVVDYEVVPYTRLGDWWVGSGFAAPSGRTPWWVPNRAFQPAHLAAYSDPRILADILRRLRGEEPFTTEPPAPLPEGEIGREGAASPEA